MLVQAAESRFQRGLAALEQGRALEAMALFEAAIEVERRIGARPPQARYLSYYGLCLARGARQPREGVALCRKAITMEFFNADLFLNLGRALMLARRKKEAFEAFSKGLAVQQNHEGILRELASLGSRREPVLAFLPRGNPVNVALGKMLRGK